MTSEVAKANTRMALYVIVIARKIYFQLQHTFKCPLLAVVKCENDQ